jgi:hypothetical protein
MRSTWRSRLYHMTEERNFAAILVDAEVIETPVRHLTRVYADGELVDSSALFNEVDCLPAGFEALKWEIEIVSNLKISAVSMAEDVDELGRV